MRCQQFVAARRVQVACHHFLHHRFETGARLPAEAVARLARVPQQGVDLRRTEVLRVDGDDRLAHHDPGRLVAVNGGGQFAAWSTSDDKTVLAQAAPAEPPKAEPVKVPL